MPESSHDTPAPSAEQAEAGNFAPQMQAWADFIHANSIYDLIHLGEVEETPDGNIQAVETPQGLEGEAAVVTMPHGMKSDTPHLHHNEHEGHLVVSGSALMSKGGENIELTPGTTVVVEPEVPHFTIPSDAGDYIEIAISFPGYNPENQVPVDLGNPPESFDLDLYAEAQARG